MNCIVCKMKCVFFQKLYNDSLHYKCAIKMEPEKLYFLIHPINLTHATYPKADEIRRNRLNSVSKKSYCLPFSS